MRNKLIRTGTNKTTSLWSKRYSTARGWHWKLERECDIATAEQWKEVFIKDEPNVTFLLSINKPKDK